MHARKPHLLDNLAALQLHLIAQRPERRREGPAHLVYGNGVEGELHLVADARVAKAPRPHGEIPRQAAQPETGRNAVGSHRVPHAHAAYGHVLPLVAGGTSEVVRLGRDLVVVGLALRRVPGIAATLALEPRDLLVELPVSLRLADVEGYAGGADDTGEGSRRIRPAREAKQVDLVARVIVQ